MEKTQGMLAMELGNNKTMRWMRPQKQAIMQKQEASFLTA